MNIRILDNAWNFWNRCETFFPPKKGYSLEPGSQTCLDVWVDGRMAEWLVKWKGRYYEYVTFAER